MASVELSVRGMTCDHCRKTVEVALQEVPGVWGASVDLAAGRAEVQCDPKKVAVDRLIDAVVNAGYEVEGVT